MVAVDVAVALLGYALGALGGGLVFIEFFQTPSYVSYDTQIEWWDIDMSPDDVDEYSWAGRIGALLVALAFALEFVATLL